MLPQKNGLPIAKRAEQLSPGTYRSSRPAERRCTWEESGSGRPFHSQWTCGSGEPVATHSMLTDESATVLSSSAASPLPFMTGGTERWRDAGPR